MNAHKSQFALSVATISVSVATAIANTPVKAELTSYNWVANGTFNGTTTIQAQSIATSDVNLDGKMDIVTATQSTVPAVWLGTGDGKFVASSQSINLNAEAVAVGDLAGDGRPDILSCGSGTPTILKGLGNGNFSMLKKIPIDLWSCRVSIIADFNGDGKNDAMLSYPAYRHYIFLGDNAGNLTYHSSFADGIASIGGVATDVDRDGDQDIVLSNTNGQSGMVFVNNGKAQFSLHSRFGGIVNYYTINALDANKDGYDDMLVNEWGSKTHLYLNDKRGNFSLSPTTAPSFGWKVTGIVLGKFDGDADLDAIAGNQIFLNQGPLLSITPSQGQFKDSPVLGTDATQAATTLNIGGGDAVIQTDLTKPHHPGRIIVGFRPGASPDSRQSAVQNLGGQVALVATLATSSVAGDMMRVSVPNVGQALAALRGNPAVSFAEPDYVIKASAIPNDPLYKSQWGLPKISAPQAWDFWKGSPFVYANIDTGCDINHPDLKAVLWRNPGEIPGNGIDDDKNGFIDDINGFNFIRNTANVMDDHGHGTHTIAITSTQTNNRLGVAGTAWSGGQAMCLKFLDSSGSGYLSDAVRAIEYAKKMGVKLSNNSWGGSSSYTLYAAMQSSPDHLFVVAAGNTGGDTLYPCKFGLPNVLCVGASTSTDQIPSFSSRSAVDVDLFAPGQGILSALPGNRYASWSGTSMATPFVTGAAMLHWSKFPSLTVPELKAQIMAFSDRSSAFSGKSITGGRLNLNKALTNVNQPIVFTVKNIGQSILVGVGKPVLSGDTSFTVLNNSCQASGLAPNATCQVTVKFTPTTIGKKNASLLFDSNAPTTENMPLQGTGISIATGSATTLRSGERRSANEDGATPAASFDPASNEIQLRVRYQEQFFDMRLCLASVEPVAFSICDLNLAENLSIPEINGAVQFADNRLLIPWLRFKDEIAAFQLVLTFENNQFVLESLVPIM